jgi:hypothetical protein
MWAGAERDEIHPQETPYLVSTIQTWLIHLFLSEGYTSKGHIIILSVEIAVAE